MQESEASKNSVDKIEIEIATDKLERGKIIQNTTFCIPSPWSLKIRVDEANQLGIYFCSKNCDESLKPNHDIRKGREFFNFHTAIYNFQIENNSPVYDTCGIFGFPKAWNYLYGPSKLADIEFLKQSLKSKMLHIKCWVRDGLLHSGLLHYICANMEEYMENATEDDLILTPTKDLYSLLESEELKIKNEDSLLLFLEKYGKYHPDDNINDLLKSIRLSKVSTEALLTIMKNVVFNRNGQFVNRVTTELDFRSKFFANHRTFMDSII